MSWCVPFKCTSLITGFEKYLEICTWCICINTTSAVLLMKLLRCFFFWPSTVICEAFLRWAAGREWWDSGRRAGGINPGCPPHTRWQRSTGTYDPPPWPRTSSPRSPEKHPDYLQLIPLYVFMEFNLWQEQRGDLSSDAAMTALNQLGAQWAALTTHMTFFFFFFFFKSLIIHCVKHPLCCLSWLKLICLMFHPFITFSFK